MSSLLARVADDHAGEVLLLDIEILFSPDQVIQEDQKLLMYYDVAVMRLGSA